MVNLHVDDMLIASNDNNRLEEIVTKLSNVFEMTDLGEPTQFLGLQIKRDRQNRRLMIHQSRYIEEMLKKFKMDESKPQGTPMVTRQVTNRELKRRLEDSTAEELVEQSENIPYREAIGSLLYLAGTVRPDIAFSVSYLARKQMFPTLDDWKDVKRVFRYLKGTKNFDLMYRGKEEKLEAMTDASFRDCRDSASTSGYILRLFGDTIA